MYQGPITERSGPALHEAVQSAHAAPSIETWIEHVYFYQYQPRYFLVDTETFILTLLPSHKRCVQVRRRLPYLFVPKDFKDIEHILRKQSLRLFPQCSGVDSKTFETFRFAASPSSPTVYKGFFLKVCMYLCVASSSNVLYRCNA